jgi:hypothetical protein
MGAWRWLVALFGIILGSKLAQWHILLYSLLAPYFQYIS